MRCKFLEKGVTDVIDRFLCIFLIKKRQDILKTSKNTV